MTGKEITQKINGRINPEDIKFLIWYGSRIGNDIDLMAVLKKETRIRLYEPSKLDVLTIGKDEFVRRARLFDPVVTEPLLTGFLLQGGDNEFSELRSEAILSLSLPREATRFLRLKARERLRNARIRLERGGKDNLFSSLVNLSFACSYHEFAKYYGNGPEFLPITFGHLLALNGKSVLKEIMGCLENVKSGKEFNKNQMIDLFKKTQELLEVVN